MCDLGACIHVLACSRVCVLHVSAMLAWCFYTRRPVSSIKSKERNWWWSIFRHGFELMCTIPEPCRGCIMCATYSMHNHYSMHLFHALIPCTIPETCRGCNMRATFSMHNYYSMHLFQLQSLFHAQL